MFKENTPHFNDNMDLFAAFFQNYGRLLTHLPFDPTFGPLQNIFNYGGFTGTASMSGSGVARFSAVTGDTTFMNMVVDTKNTQPWNSIEKRFTEAGEMTSRVTVKDDGIVQEDVYVDGARVAKRLNDSGDERPWTQITNYYDETGRVSKVTDYDNGVQREDFFEDGQRVRTVQRDSTDENKASWLLIEAEYDADGKLSERVTTYDDGSTRLETFVNGVRASVMQTDGDVSSRSWHTITVTYSDQGLLLDKSTVQDDGVLRLDAFEDGYRTQVLLIDVEDTQDWSSSERIYAEYGLIESVRTIDDTDDVTLMLYAGGMRDERVELDADDSELWAVRVTHYDETGVVDVETYVDSTEILGNYSNYFESDFIM